MLGSERSFEVALPPRLGQAGRLTFGLPFPANPAAVGLVYDRASNRCLE